MRKRFVAIVFMVTTVSILIGCSGSDKPAERRRPVPKRPSASTDSKTVTAAVDSTGTAVIIGEITFEGKAPKKWTKSLAEDMAVESVCIAEYSDDPVSDSIVLGKENQLANVFVHIAKGVPTNAEYATPSEPVVIDQKGCMYKPHVVGAMVGQEIKILNSDGIMHNVHALPAKNTEFNKAMPKTKKTYSHTFEEAEPIFPIKCDVHPWMGGYIGISNHPFFNVTDIEGKFEIRNLPAGTYDVKAWHEKLGTQTQAVTVEDGKTHTLNFTLSKS